MGIRSKIKGRLKSALSGASKPEAPPEAEPAPQSKHAVSISQDSGGGNLRDEADDLPWYLKYDDNDGWESTDVEQGSEDD